MLLTEVKKNGIYKATLKVQFRDESEVKEVDLLVRVTSISPKGYVEVTFLNDLTNDSHWLCPSQLSQV